MTETASNTTCPSCGNQASGKFCTHCGAPLTQSVCSNCQAPLSPRARFCHACGTPTGAGGGKHAKGSGTIPLPWTIAAASLVIVVLVIAVRFSNSATPPSEPAGAPQAAATTSAPDISSMTPREQADRLFDMIMTAAEAGDTARVEFHTTMAIQAYQMLGELDADARYHVGLIHIVRGETDEALAQAAALEAEVPNHLLASLLRHSVARAAGDDDAAQAAYRDFLAHYESEIAVARPEYDMHRNSIDSFLDAARVATGAAGN